ncbi:MAG: cbiX [Acidimicrobiales bacterium]|nr:cbiX [Acidimicrobiales bacterium]
MAGSTVVVLAAHGSRRGDANDAHRELAVSVGAALDDPVLPAFLELAEPSIGDAVDQAVAGGADRVLVLPYFLHPGNHTTHDIPAIAAQARSRHPGVTIEVLPLFGGDAGLAALIAAQVHGHE